MKSSLLPGGGPKIAYSDNSSLNGDEYLKCIQVVTCKVVADEVGSVGIVGAAPSSKGFGFSFSICSRLGSSTKSGVFSVTRISCPPPVLKGMR